MKNHIKYIKLIKTYSQKIATMSLFFILVLIVNACKKDRLVNQKEIHFWHFQSEPNQKKVLVKLLAEFEKENNCKVILTDLSWKDGKTKLFAAFNSNSEPDVIELGSDWVAQFSSSKVLAELDYNAVGFDDFIPFATEPCLYKGKIYSLPWYVDTRVLFYNKDLLNSSNINIDSVKTFDDLLVASKKIQENTYLKDKYGFAVNGPDAHRLYKKIVTFLWSYGGELIDKNGEFVFNSKNNIEAVQSYKDFLKYGKLENQRTLDADFIQGNIGFAISGAWILEKIKNENPSLNFGVMKIPSTKYSNGISFAGGEYLAVTRFGGNKPLAKKLVSYLAEGKTAIRFCKEIPEAGFPADKVYFKDEFYKTQAIRSVFADQLEFARLTPVHKDWLDIEELLEAAVEEVIYNKKSPKKAMNDLQNKVNKKFKRK